MGLEGNSILSSATMWALSKVIKAKPVIFRSLGHLTLLESLGYAVCISHVYKGG